MYKIGLEKIKHKGEDVYTQQGSMQADHDDDVEIPKDTFTENVFKKKRGKIACHELFS